MYVVSIISGKGGCGKTSVAIALAQIISILKRKTLLVDLDTATHGASYFFDSVSPGLEEWILSHTQKRGKEDEFSSPTGHTDKIDFLECIRSTKTEPPFAFIPSKTRFKPTKWDVDHVTGSSRKVYLQLKKLIDSSEYDYLILDCQAGVNHLTAKALQLSTHAVIVTEVDSVSTKALKNIQQQFKHVLPSETKALINKLFLKERTSYDQLTSVLRGLDFLPPIPFDMDIRDAFARNEIPLRQGKPSAFFSAMLRIVRELFRDLVDNTHKMVDSLRRTEFGNYEEKLVEIDKTIEDLNNDKASLIADIQYQRERIERIRRLLVPMVILFSSLVPATFLILSEMSVGSIPLNKLISYFIGGLGVAIAYIWIVWDIFYRKRRRLRKKHDEQLAQIEEELKELKEEKEKYMGLYITERREYLL